MSDTKTFKCPSCGSALEPDGDEKEVKCPYCGSTVIVPEELLDQDTDQDTDEEEMASGEDASSPRHIQWLIQHGADATVKVDKVKDSIIYLSGKRADGGKYKSEAGFAVPPLPAFPQRGTILKIKYNPFSESDFVIQVDGQFYGQWRMKNSTIAYADDAPPVVPGKFTAKIAPTPHWPAGVPTETTGDGQPLSPDLHVAMVEKDQYYVQLRQIGIEAKAVVISSSNINIRCYNKAWVYDMTFDVTAPTGEHFQSRTQQAITDTGAYKLAVGKMAIIRFDPKNKAQCALVRAIVPEELRDHALGEEVNPDIQEMKTEVQEMKTDAHNIKMSMEQIAADVNRTATLLRLRKSGVEARAKILSADDMHMRVRDIAWLYHFTLDVTDATTGQHFTSQSEGSVPDALSPKYQVGKEVIVHYDPRHKELVAIVHSAEN